MSFSHDAKNEMCRNDLSDCCALAELYGILLFSNTFSPTVVRIITGRETFKNRVIQLCGNRFGETVGFTQTVTATGKFSLSITNPDMLWRLLSRFGYDTTGALVLRLNAELLTADCCRRSFIRGVFCAGGFVADPDKLYHLELVTPHKQLSRDVISLLYELDFNPKLIRRQHNEVIYFKESEYIEDFLIMCGAVSASMRMMEAKVVKDVRNRANRANNCDAANIGRTIDASQAQCEAIERLTRAAGIDSLPPPLAQAARLRLEHPDAPLSVLCGLADPPISRSGLNHRLSRLVSLAEKLNSDQ